MNKFLLITRYVEGDLNAEEYREFETVVACDAELREYLNSYNNIHASLNSQINEAFGLGSLTMPNSREEKYVAEKITHTTDHIWYLTVALIIAVGLFIWKPWNPDLYKQYKVDDKQVVAQLQSNKNEEFHLAANFVKKKQYYDAKLVVSKLYMKNPEDVGLSYYYAIILLQNNSHETIREVLSPILSGNSSYKDAASYVLALSYLQQKKMAECKVWLDKISKDSTYFPSVTSLKSQLAEQSV